MKLSPIANPMHLATRIIEASESGNWDSLHRELTLAEALVHHGDERLELLGALATDMKRAIGKASISTHLHLVRHLAASAWVN